MNVVDCAFTRRQLLVLSVFALVAHACGSGDGDDVSTDAEPSSPAVDDTTRPISEPAPAPPGIGTPEDSPPPPTGNMGCGDPPVRPDVPPIPNGYTPPAPLADGPPPASLSSTVHSGG